MMHVIFHHSVVAFLHSLDEQAASDVYRLRESGTSCRLEETKTKSQLARYQYRSQTPPSLLRYIAYMLYYSP